MKVKFSCESHLMGAIPEPLPAIKKAPEYFKQIKPQANDHPGSSTVKRCVPFLDALSAGYIISLWSDVYIFAKNGDIRLDFPNNFFQKSGIEPHEKEQISGHPLYKKMFGNIPLKWMSPWVIETEPGVSCLFTSPFNHFETRLKIVDGIVDTDTYYNNIHFPFLWTGGEGQFFLEKGTPLVQVIPFRRETYEVEVCPIDSEKLNKTHAVLGSRIKNIYRNEFWSKSKKYKEDNDLALEDSISENNNEHVVVQSSHQDPASDLKENSSSGILEVVADDNSRGFGEGTF